MVTDLRNRRLSQVVDKTLDAVEHELRDAEEELVSAGLSGKQDTFQRVFSDIIRHAVTRALKEEMNEISRIVVDNFSTELNGLESAMVQFGNEPNWMEAFSGRIKQSLQKGGEILGNWSKALARSDGAVTGKISVLGYRSLATILAVTTSVINPLLELAIIFLPEILKLFGVGDQREKLRQKIRTEAIPACKRELRDKLDDLLAEQMNNLVEQVGARFAQQIEEQTRAIEAYQGTANADETSRKLERLAQAREHIQRLAAQVL